jgi:hypothetical protein
VAYNYTRGDFGYFLFQAAGGPLTTICVTAHNIDIEVLTYEIINTCSGGLMWKLTGRTDAKGTFNADYDLDAPPYVAPQSIIAGTRGIAVFGLAPNKGIQMPSIIKKTHYEIAMQAQVKYSSDLELDARQGQLVYPAFP